MVVDVFPVSMSGNNKGVFAFQKSGGQFVADAVGFLCRDFTGPEGLPYLIGDDIAFWLRPVACSYSFFVSMNSSSTVSGLH